MKVYYNMKRKVLISSIFIFSFLLLLPIFLFGCNSEKTLKNLTCYNLDLEYNDSTNTLSGTEKVDFVNNYNNMFTSLYFHLYPNAFREGAKASVVSSANEDEAYPNGLSYGNIVIKNVTSENSQLNFSIEGSDENILIIDLDQEVYPDENIILNIGRYDKFSKYNDKNITKYLREKQQVSVVPYNTLFFEACSEGTVIDLLLKLRSITDDTDRNVMFVKELKNLDNNIIVKMQELQMKK